MISAIIIAKNEEKNISECIQSVSWCDEVILIDDNSTDRTTEIAKTKGVRVYAHDLKNDFSQQRNFGLEKAHGEWIMFVDADERISPALWYEIMAITNDPVNTMAGYFVKRKDIMWGKKLRYGETKNIRLLRLARKEAGTWRGKVHETWVINGKTGVLKNHLIHYPHQTIKEFLLEINYYTEIRSRELYKNKIHTTWLSILIYPKAKFIMNYFLKGGLFDGIPGLVYALMMSLHSFLVRGKLWLLWQKNK